MKKDIFSDLYDRVLSFFITQNQNDTKLMAKSRLKTVLMQDRVGFSERAMQMLKDDMIETISRYLELDIDKFDLSIDALDEKTVLNLSIPVLRPKTDDEIDEAISIAQKEKIEKTQEIVGELQELVKEKAQELAGMSDEDSKDESENCSNKEEDDDESEKTEDDSETQEESLIETEKNNAKQNTSTKKDKKRSKKNN